MLANEKWKAGIALSFVTILCALAWWALLNEKAVSEGRLHVHKPVAFPQNTPELKTYTLVFFGYVGCPTVCTPRMQEVAAIYKAFSEKNKSGELSVLFINLKETISTQDADAYAKTFHPDFIGVTYQQHELLTTLRMFQAYYSHSLIDAQELEHTQFLYSVHKDTSGNFYLNNIYIHIPYNKEIVVNDLIKEFK